MYFDAKNISAQSIEEYLERLNPTKFDSDDEEFNNILLNIFNKNQESVVPANTNSVYNQKPIVNKPKFNNLKTGNNVIKISLVDKKSTQEKVGSVKLKKNNEIIGENSEKNNSNIKQKRPYHRKNKNDESEKKITKKRKTEKSEKNTSKNEFEKSEIEKKSEKNEKNFDFQDYSKMENFPMGDPNQILPYLSLSEINNNLPTDNNELYQYLFEQIQKPDCMIHNIKDLQDIIKEFK